MFARHLHVDRHRPESDVGATNRLRGDAVATAGVPVGALARDLVDGVPETDANDDKREDDALSGVKSFE